MVTHTFSRRLQAVTSSIYKKKNLYINFWQLNKHETWYKAQRIKKRKKKRKKEKKKRENTYKKRKKNIKKFQSLIIKCTLTKIYAQISQRYENKNKKIIKD